MPNPIKHAIKSPLRYPGGKQKAIARIAKVFPKSAYEYRDPMVGGGSVFFHAKQIGFAQKYWINDIDRELMSFWQITQDPMSCARLVDELEDLRKSFGTVEEAKAYFESTRRSNPTERYRQALLFFFFNRVTFSGTAKAGGFSGKAATSRFTASSINRIKPLPKILSETIITDTDFEAMITDSGKDVFLFLDPPHYKKASKIYGRGGTYDKFDHKKLADLLEKTKHRFLITADDCPEIRKLYSWANMQEWSVKYGMTNCNTEHSTKTGSELFVFNY